ncbi:hypothetical protein [Candidatus Fukatsuia endosymbiont of Tuberolachnus salignus]
MAKPDWEAIESAYRAGALSVRAIAKRYGLPRGCVVCPCDSKTLSGT